MKPYGVPPASRPRLVPTLMTGLASHRLSARATKAQGCAVPVRRMALSAAWGVSIPEGAVGPHARVQVGVSARLIRSVRSIAELLLDLGHPAFQIRKARDGHPVFQDGSQRRQPD